MLDSFFTGLRILDSFSRDLHSLFGSLGSFDWTFGVTSAASEVILGTLGSIWDLLDHTGGLQGYFDGIWGAFWGVLGMPWGALGIQKVLKI